MIQYPDEHLNHQGIVVSGPHALYGISGDGFSMSNIEGWVKGLTSVLSTLTVMLCINTSQRNEVFQ